MPCCVDIVITLTPAVPFKELYVPALRLWKAVFGDRLEKDLSRGGYLKVCITKGAFENYFMIRCLPILGFTTV